LAAVAMLSIHDNRRAPGERARSGNTIAPRGAVTATD